MPTPYCQKIIDVITWSELHEPTGCEKHSPGSCPDFSSGPTSLNRSRLPEPPVPMVYLVAVLGVTGVRDHVSEEAIDLLTRVRRYTTLPLALGFGISTPAHANVCTCAGADGVIVGSAIVEIVERNLKDTDTMVHDLQDYVSSMKKGLGLRDFA